MVMELFLVVLGCWSLGWAFFPTVGPLDAGVEGSLFCIPDGYGGVIAVDGV